MKDFNMRRVLFFVIILVFSSFKTKNVDRDSFELLSFERFRAEMRSFINYVRPESFRNGKYNVYLAKFTDDRGTQPCVTLEYIFDTLRPVSDLQNFDHFTVIDSSLVLLSFDNNFLEKYDFRDSTVNRLNDVSLITDRLYKGDFFSSLPAWVVCFEENVVSVRKYPNESLLPPGLRIFPDRSKGVIRQIDKSEFKHKRKN